MIKCFNTLKTIEDVTVIPLNLKRSLVVLKKGTVVKIVDTGDYFKTVKIRRENSKNEYLLNFNDLKKFVGIKSKRRKNG